MAENQMPDEQLKRVLAFFDEQLAANPAIATAAKLHSIEPHIDLRRAENLGKLDSKFFKMISVTLLTDVLPFSLKTPIWYVEYYFPSQSYNGVVAEHKESFLWLDNHIDDSDFQLFIAGQEIPLDNGLDLATFLLQTKFQYLTLGFKAKVISEKSDIPQWHDLPPEIEAEFRDYLDEKKAKLDSIGQIIAPPSIEKRLDGVHLTFFIWTHVFGSIYKLDCTFGNGGSFTWIGKSLGNDVGKSFIPK